MRAKKLTELPAPKTIRGMSAIFLELACVLVISFRYAKSIKIDCNTNTHIILSTIINDRILIFILNTQLSIINVMEFQV